MRRLRDRRPTTLFRGAEFPRLMTMIVMLGVIVMLINRAKDPATWTAIAHDSDASSDSDSGDDGPSDNSLTSNNPAASLPTAIDQDPEERNAAQQEFDLVTDNFKLSATDNPAYWRLIRWAEAQTMADLHRRARKNIMFTQLWEHPDEHRGELVQLRLHIKRVLTYPAHDEKTPGVNRLYEAWGWTDESRSELYVVVFPELPKGMKLGSELYEEATFIGYFLKLLPYKSREDKWRGSPLLVGRIIWHPPLHAEANQAGEWKWGLGLGGGGVLLLLALRWLPKRLKRGTKPDRPLRERLATDEDDSVPIEDWLERAEEPETGSEIDHAVGHGANGSPGVNGNGAAGLLTDRLDGSKDRDG